MRKTHVKFTAVLLAAALSIALLGACDLTGSTNRRLEALEEKVGGYTQLEQQLNDTIYELENKLKIIEGLIDGIDGSGELIEAVTVVDGAIKSIVAVQVTTSKGTSLGSGFFADYGIIVTNSHVVEGRKSATSLTVKYNDGITSGGEVIIDSPLLDMAVIKVSRTDIAPLALSPDSLSIGERVIAIGTPVDIDMFNTVTSGVVSGLERVVSSESGTLYEYVVQHDASINPGNSGGVLIDMLGHVVGINTLGMTDYEGLGFAIDIKPLTSIIASLKSDSSWRLPVIGIGSCDRLTAPLIKNVTFTDVGISVLSVTENGAAAAAGLKEGDRIIQIGDAEVSTSRDFICALYTYKKGDRVTVKYIRSGSERTATVTLK